MKRMDQLDSSSSSLNTLYAILSPILLWLGYYIDGLQVFWAHHQILIEVIKDTFECFAWGGGGTIGLVTFIKFLQDNGWIRKGKPKNNG